MFKLWMYVLLLFSLSALVVGDDDNPVLSDPTQPLGYRAAQSQPQQYQLNSIFKSIDGAKAIINGQLVREKSEVNGAKVLSIGEGHVVIQTNTGVQTLNLHRNIKNNSNTH